MAPLRPRIQVTSLLAPWTAPRSQAEIARVRTQRSHACPFPCRPCDISRFGVAGNLVQDLVIVYSDWFLLIPFALALSMG